MCCPIAGTSPLHSIHQRTMSNAHHVYHGDTFFVGGRGLLYLGMALNTRLRSQLEYRRIPFKGRVIHVFRGTKNYENNQNTEDVYTGPALFVLW